MSGRWLTPKPGAFDGVRALDGVWLEHLLDDTDRTRSRTSTGSTSCADCSRTDPTVTAAVLIRPVSVAEIERTAREGC